MPKVTCTRPNASEHISGVDFVRQKDGSVVAEGVSPELAAQFVNFEGFTVEDERAPVKTAAVKPEPVKTVAVEDAPVDTAAVEPEIAKTVEPEKEPAGKKKTKADPVA